jgi:hypothetical protein
MGLAISSRIVNLKSGRQIGSLLLRSCYGPLRPRKILLTPARPQPLHIGATWGRVFNVLRFQRLAVSTFCVFNDSRSQHVAFSMTRVLNELKTHVFNDLRFQRVVFNQLEAFMCLRDVAKLLSKNNIELD